MSTSGISAPILYYPEGADTPIPVVSMSTREMAATIRALLELVERLRTEVSTPATYPVGDGRCLTGPELVDQLAVSPRRVPLSGVLEVIDFVKAVENPSFAWEAACHMIRVSMVDRFGTP